MLLFRSLGLSLYSIFCNDSFFSPLSGDVYILSFIAKVVKFPTDVTHVGNLSEFSKNIMNSFNLKTHVSSFFKHDFCKNLD